MVMSNCNYRWRIFTHTYSYNDMSTLSFSPTLERSLCKLSLPDKDSYKLKKKKKRNMLLVLSHSNSLLSQYFIRRFHLSCQSFSEAKNEIGCVLLGVLLGSMHRKRVRLLHGHKSTPGNAQKLLKKSCYICSWVQKKVTQVIMRVVSDSWPSGRVRLLEGLLNYSRNPKRALANMKLTDEKIVFVTNFNSLINQ